MRKIILAVVALTCLSFSFSAFASGKCDKIKRRLQRLEQKGKTNTWRYKKLTKKLQFCDESGSFNRDGWKSERGNFKSNRKCVKLQRRMERACGRKPDGRRCQKRKGKFESLGCAGILNGMNQGLGVQAEQPMGY